jgi:hypothetical protein
MNSVELTPLQVTVGFLMAACLMLGMLCAVLVPRCVDPEKIRKEEDRKLIGMMSNPWLPRRVLTPLGVKIWFVRNFLLIAGVVLVAVSFAMQ